MNPSPNFESHDTYSIWIQSTDSSGLSVEQLFNINVNEIHERKINLPPTSNVQIGQSLHVPINISDASGVESLDLNLSYDPTIFSSP
jgi:Cohesin domain.